MLSSTNFPFAVELDLSVEIRWNKKFVIAYEPSFNCLQTFFSYNSLNRFLSSINNEEKYQQRPNEPKKKQIWIKFEQCWLLLFRISFWYSFSLSLHFIFSAVVRVTHFFLFWFRFSVFFDFDKEFNFFFW